MPNLLFAQPALPRSPLAALLPSRNRRWHRAAVLRPEHVDVPERRLQPLRLWLFHQALGPALVFRVADVSFGIEGVEPDYRGDDWWPHGGDYLSGFSGHRDYWGPEGISVRILLVYSS
jgi:hypothetical protein